MLGEIHQVGSTTARKARCESGGCLTSVYAGFGGDKDFQIVETEGSPAAILYASEEDLVRAAVRWIQQIPEEPTDSVRFAPQSGMMVVTNMNTASGLTTKPEYLDQWAQEVFAGSLRDLVMQSTVADPRVLAFA